VPHVTTNVLQNEGGASKQTPTTQLENSARVRCGMPAGGCLGHQNCCVAWSCFFEQRGRDTGPQGCNCAKTAPIHRSDAVEDGQFVCPRCKDKRGFEKAEHNGNLKHVIAIGKLDVSGKGRPIRGDHDPGTRSLASAGKGSSVGHKRRSLIQDRPDELGLLVKTLVQR